MILRIETYQPDHLPLLFAYWLKLGAGIPYFFPVSEDHWETCLLVDRLEGEVVFKHLETYLAFKGESLLGFVQLGQPSFSWNEQGVKYPDPSFGVIRHLYFEEGYPEAGRALLMKAEGFLDQFPRSYAFYHILGMSCNAYHGKLHASLAHVEALLLERSFQIEHENLYYVLELHNQRPLKLLRIEFLATPNTGGKQRFEACLEGIPVGSAEIRYLAPLTGGCTSDVAYLTWIGIEGPWRGRGLGSEFLGALATCLQAQGFHFLHTDTASTNLTAQQFYVKLGFRNQGHTRSYWKQR